MPADAFSPNAKCAQVASAVSPGLSANTEVILAFAKEQNSYTESSRADWRDR